MLTHCDLLTTYECIGLGLHLVQVMACAWRQWFITWNNIDYSDVIMGAIASQITSLTIVYSSVYSGADQRKHQSSASLAFVRGIHRRPVNSPHKGPVTRKMFPFDDVIMDSNVVLWRPPENNFTWNAQDISTIDISLKIIISRLQLRLPYPMC